jgi:hypothetical protein
MKKNTLLHKIDDGHGKPPGSSLFKIIFYLIIIGIAFYFGKSLMSSSKPANPETAYQTEPPPGAAPSAAPVVPIAVATPTPVTPAPIPVVPAPPVHVENTPPPAPSVTAPPMTSPGTVTVTEAVEVPMKHGGSVVGFINLQPGQQIKPFSMDDKQLMIRFGDNVGSVPISSTSLKH